MATTFLEQTRERRDPIVKAGRAQTRSRAGRKYLRRIEHVAWYHLRWLSCCETLLDAIGHVSRNDGKPEEDGETE